MATSDKLCSVLLSYDGQMMKESELQERLESKEDENKILALKSLIAALINGEQYPKLLMSVIKFCLHSENHTIKKLLLLYWEVVEKKSKDGQLLHEMILVCNAMKNNLCHPNEYIRGCTLRFLCKIKEHEILESLIPSIVDNLKHRHSYVRKNAVLTVLSVYETQHDLIPDAAELLEEFLVAETNPAAQRNAFLMLYLCNQELAINFLNSVLNNVGNMSESFQLAVLELIRKVCRANPAYKAQYIRCIYSLVNSNSHAVAYEGANTLVALSSAPTAVRAAVTAYCTLMTQESDNNVKLVILQRLAALRRRNSKVLEEMLMDVMRALSTPNLEIRRQTVEMALSLLNQRNVDDVVQVLKKQLTVSDSPEHGAVGRVDGSRKLFVDALHQCAVKFPHVVSSVVHILIGYVGDEQASAALDVMYFVREIVEEYPQLRATILTKVFESFSEIRSSDVFRVTLWIIGEYATEPELMQKALAALHSAVGPLPLVEVRSADPQAGGVPAGGASTEEAKKAVVAEETGQKSRIHHVEKMTKKPPVLADGTYASQSAASSAAQPVVEAVKTTSMSSLRSMLVNGDFFLASCLANSVTKLVLRYASHCGHGTVESNKEIANTLLLLVSVLRVGALPSSQKQVDPDSQQRIMLCIRTLLDPEIGAEAFSRASRDVYSTMLKSLRKEVGTKSVEMVKQVDDLISIRQLKGRNATDEDLLEDDETDISKAVASTTVNKDISVRLGRVHQLTGFADPVYAEVQLSVQSYDILLDILVVNQTSTILQNLSLDLYTSGDLKVVERPAVSTLAPHAVQRVTSSIKLTSTESGLIYGNIVYDNASGTHKTVVVLNNIHIDIIDYIHPATCSDQLFRSMWAEFEWENKVGVNTELTDLNAYLQHIVAITNMRCLTPELTLSGDCNFLAANLYARSIFGEDALLNLSVELQRNGKITGFIRIRSKTQGIALSLGDKITSKQRSA